MLHVYVYIAFTLGVLAKPATCFSVVGGDAGSRRDMLKKTVSTIVGGATTVAAASPALAKEEKATAVLRSAGCARGTGEACADLAEGNEFILKLQQKSQENAAMRLKPTLMHWRHTTIRTSPTFWPVSTRPNIW